MDLQLNGWRGSNKVLDFQQVSKRFKTQQVLTALDFTLLHGERVGVIGANGSGKSVLLRLATGLMMQPDEGDVVLGPSVKIGYYAQEHETLDFQQTLIDCVQRGRPNEGRQRSFLLEEIFIHLSAGRAKNRGRSPVGSAAGCNWP